MKILVVAPHADDEALGVGGTIARYASEGHEVIVAIMTGHGEDAPHPLWPKSSWEQVRREAKEAHAILGVQETVFREVPAAMVANEAAWKLNLITQEVVKDVQPDILYLPFLFDLHKDHREISHSFSVTWRPCTEFGQRIREIYMYETQSETHWNIPYLEQGFFPNSMVDISDYLDTKLDALRCYKSQMRPFPDARSIEAVEALAKWRGSQISRAAAEGFVVVRHIK
ncbi:MAG: hypothetical protein AMJ53_06625 [Gammaproteobacteria bacterium SG8_11]|nr:MAG: hypothetical protein AMJ53_06625 [Gammaproteobacteria bacterium SG8_11]